MINKEKMYALADFVEQQSEKTFNMAWFSHGAKAATKEHLNVCGTSCCVAGHQCLLDGYAVYADGAYTPKQDKPCEIDKYIGEVPDLAAESLGLDAVQAKQLFYYGADNVDFDHLVENGSTMQSISAKHMARKIREMADHGHIEFDLTVDDLVGVEVVG